MFTFFKSSRRIYTKILTVVQGMKFLEVSLFLSYIESAFFFFLDFPFKKKSLLKVLSVVKDQGHFHPY